MVVVVVVVGVVVLVFEFQSTVAPLVLLKELLLEELKALWLLGESQELRVKVRIIKGISLFIFILMHLLDIFILLFIILVGVSSKIVEVNICRVLSFLNLILSTYH